MKHRVTFLPQHLTTHTFDGATILDAANWAGLPMDSACGGHGACGRCKVRLLDSIGPAAEADRRFLSEAQLSEGWRLACRTAIHTDCTVEAPQMRAAPQTVPLACGRHASLSPNVRKHHLSLLRPAPGDSRSALQRLLDALRCAGYEARAVSSLCGALPTSFSVTAVMCGDELIAVEPGDTTARSFGLALDIGTTTVVGALVNLATGETEAVESLLNAQVAFGADVIARISYGNLHEGGLGNLQLRIAATINQLVDRALARCGAARENIYEAIAVGNATMLHLLLGIDPAAIGVSPFTAPVPQDVTVPAAELGLHLHPEARLSTLPHLGAYVGADIVAGLLATNLMRQDDGKLRLYIDVGTNSEIVLGMGERWLCTAAPAGPAFEGAEIRCGMRAAEGAIEHVEIDNDVRLQVVGGAAQPAGICGSGLVDAVAELLKCGVIDASGRFLQPEVWRHRLIHKNGMSGFLLSEPDIVLTQPDVRALQLAKAAIASGTRVLLAQLGAHPADLHEVLLAGAFGSYLNPASARAIGLVPWVSLDRIIPVGNAAGEGARIALLSHSEREAARQMPRYVEYVELSGHPQLNDIFTDALAFPPQPA